MYVSGEARDVVEGLLEGARGVNVKYIVVNGAETEYSPVNKNKARDNCPQ